MIIYVGVNKSGSASLHTVEPVRNKNTGMWVSLRPYVNSTINKSMNSMIKHSQMTWEMEPEFIEINLSKQIKL